VKWKCEDGTTVPIDRYEVEGGSREVATVLFWKRKRVVTLVKWSVNSRASDFQGNFYKIYIYKFNDVKEAHPQPFVREDVIMKKFGSGWDGVMDGVVIKYPFKDAASIRKRLKKINVE
jgi:hypothetical protein